ncbi:hypothetical protein [Gordonia sp. SND2]|uniref:hypothetical protein n=1 Tax=Gordonia sp. SND2 TaxID=3388659 RepID=UPI00398B4DFF
MSDKGIGISIPIDADQLFYDVNQTPQARAAVRGRAQKIATKALAIDKKENRGKSQITLVDRTLANGRAVTEVHSTDVDGEYGNSKTKRRATLRRAAGGLGR